MAMKMNVKSNRTVLVDGYQPGPPKSGTRVVRDSATGKVTASGPKNLPKAVSAIKTPTPKNGAQ